MRQHSLTMAVRFCRERPQKAPICAELGITHFIDDRADVLEPMCGIVANRFLFGPQRAPAVASTRSLWASAVCVYSSDLPSRETARPRPPSGVGEFGRAATISVLPLAAR